jgi:hypothetical protein
VIEGAIRAYVVDERGEEHTVQLAIDEWWISDYNSYLFQQLASMFVIATEDCHVLKISYEDEQRLKAANPKFETFFRMMAEKGVAFMQRRFISAITRPPEWASLQPNYLWKKVFITGRRQQELDETVKTLGSNVTGAIPSVVS